MCVILITKPTLPRFGEQTIIAANAANQDGIGVAWLEDGKVRWRKGINVSEAVELAKTIPQPHMFHFRLATLGDSIPELTHPFPMFGNITEDLEGSSLHGVLMHNGHWSSWEQNFKKYANTRWINRYLTNRNRWSDSRGMAFLASRLGYPILSKIADTGQKIAILTRTGVSTFGNGWTTLNDGTIASNTWFQWGAGFHGWDDDDRWPGGYPGYAGYLYRTRRHHGYEGRSGHASGGRIRTVEVDESLLRARKLREEAITDGEVTEGFTYPQSCAPRKRLADLTQDEWLAREKALAEEEAEWIEHKARLHESFYGRKEWDCLCKADHSLSSVKHSGHSSMSKMDGILTGE